MVTAVSNSTSSAAATVATSSASAQAQQDRFLTLLVAQMKNQDPLNPMDNSQITTQMAQLSTVSGIEKLNATLDASTKAQAFQSVNMIGHNILAPGSSLNLSGGQAVAGVELPGAADTVQINISDANGALVKTINLGKQNQGVVPFKWDGTTDSGQVAPDGGYTFSVVGSLAGKSVAPVGLSVGLVQSVLMDQAGPALSVQGMGLVDLSQVRQIL